MEGGFEALNLLQPHQDEVEVSWQVVVLLGVVMSHLILGRTVPRDTHVSEERAY
jgi:hypothetical protein